MSRFKTHEAIAAIEARLAALEALLSPRRPCIMPAELERARLAAGWTMARAAAVVGVVPSSWSRWEHGLRVCAGDTALTVVEEFGRAGVEPPAVTE
jgi:hypothetical protein